MRISRLAAPLTACVIAGAALPSTAGAAATTNKATGPIQHVLLTLTPHDRGALRSLAHGYAVHRGRNAAALQRALPSLAQRQAVAATARSLGLTVDRSARMSVLVSGHASLIRSLFGSARSVAPHSRTQHALPGLPSALRGAVTVAFGGDDNRPAFRHYALPDNSADGGDLRTAYSDTSTDPLTLPANPAAASAMKNETIATVQLSGWRSSDLTNYASFLRTKPGKGGYPAPKYSSVDDPNLPSCVAVASHPNMCVNETNNLPGDDIEVDLDQEAIYATAPYAKQRAYLSGNDLGGFYDSLGSLGDDASDPTIDRHIVAASISWGFCETDLNTDPSASSIYSSLEDVLSYDLATGVTVFAASGDLGSKCDAQHTGVSYPASSPQVVAVGGTQHSGSVTTAPHGWVENSTAASEGGASSVFPRPSYQNGASTSSFRTVPDIAALAGTPNFDVWSSSASVAPGQNPLLIGGTSLASPVMAATYAVEVAGHGYSWGVGNILPGLYAQSASFTDVDDGCANYPATSSSCPGWNGVDVAHPGYDLVTGLGTPTWSTLVSASLGGDPHLSVGKAYNNSTTVPVAVRVPSWQTYNHYRIDVDSNRVCKVFNAPATKPTSVKIDNFGIRHGADGVHTLTLVAFNDADNVCHFSDAFVLVDTTKPAPIAGLAVSNGNKSVTAKWSGSDFSGSGIAKYVVTLGYPGKTVLSRVATHSGSISVPAKPGKTYTLTVTATDRAGNVQSTIARLLDDKAFGLSGRWKRTHAKAAFDGTLATATAAGATATAKAPGFAYTLYLTMCSTCGKVAAYVNGKQKKVIDTYSRSTRNRVGVTVFSDPFGRDATRTLTFKVLGTKSSHSRGTRVMLDGLATRG